MSIFGMRNIELERERKKERAEQAAAAQAAREAAIAEKTATLITEVINEAAQDLDGGDVLFTREQAEQMLQVFLERERALYTPTSEEQRAAELDHAEMMTKFRAELTDHGLPAEEIIDTFTSFDFTTLEGLKLAVEDMMDLYETIADYSDQYEATLAAKRKMPPKKPDVIGEIFRNGGHA